MTHAGTIDFGLLSQHGVSVKSKATFEEIDIEESIEKIDLAENSHKAQTKLEKSFDKKVKVETNTAVDRDKEMRDILELYKVQLEKASEGSGKNKFLILSEIPE